MGKENEEVVDDLTEEGDDPFAEDQTSEDGDTEDKGDEGEGEGGDGDDKKTEAETAAERKARTLERKYDKAVRRIQTLEGRKDTGKDTSQMTPEQQKELDAQKYIRDQALQALEEREQENKQKEDERKEEFNDKLDEVLSDNPDVNEKEIADIADKYEVFPDKALNILRDIQKAKGETKQKPKEPASKRGSGKLPKDTKTEEEKSKMTFEERMRYARERATKMLSAEE